MYCNDKYQQIKKLLYRIFANYDLIKKHGISGHFKYRRHKTFSEYIL